MAKQKKYIGVSVSYLLQAAKMTEYKVDVKEGLIYVPVEELDLAEADLTVRHLMGYGFKIQAEAMVSKKAVYNPVVNLTARPVRAAKASTFKLHTVYKFETSGALVRVIELSNKNVTLTYLNCDPRAPKPDLIISEEQLQKGIDSQRINRVN